MKALTLTQPWATLVAIGAKKIETRSWKTDYRGPLVIHAAKGPGEYRKSELDEIITRPFFAEALRRADGTLPRWQEMPLGQIVAVCRLVDCRYMADPYSHPFFDPDHDFDIGVRGALTQQERAFGFYADGRFAWMLDNITPIDPIHFRGGQGLWETGGQMGFPEGKYPDWLREYPDSLC